MKKIARAMLYWVPVMFKSGKRPSILALPVEMVNQQDFGQPNDGDSRTGVDFQTSQARKRATPTDVCAVNERNQV